MADMRLTNAVSSGVSIGASSSTPVVGTRSACRRRRRSGVVSLNTRDVTSPTVMATAANTATSISAMIGRHLVPRSARACESPACPAPAGRPPPMSICCPSGSPVSVPRCLGLTTSVAIASAGGRQASTQPVIRPCADSTRTWRLTLNRSRITAAEVVEDLGQVAARLALREDGRDEKPRVEHRDAPGEILHGVRERETEVLLVVQDAELGADGRLELVGHHAQAGRAARDRHAAPAPPGRWLRETVPRTCPRACLRARFDVHVRDEQAEHAEAERRPAATASGWTRTGTPRAPAQPDASRKTPTFIFTADCSSNRRMRPANPAFCSTELRPPTELSASSAFSTFSRLEPRARSCCGLRRSSTRCSSRTTSSQYGIRTARMTATNTTKAIGGMPGTRRGPTAPAGCARRAAPEAAGPTR